MTRFTIPAVLLTCLFAAVATFADEAKNELTQEEKDAGFELMFDGKSIDGWRGDTKGYVPEDGLLACKPGGNVYLPKDYANFVFRFEYKLTPGANNGVGIRCDVGKDAAYHGMEIQILDDYADQYKDLQPYQYHGSVYGVIPAKRGVTKPAGEWNTEEIYAKDGLIRVTVNGEVITEGNVWDIAETADGRDHVGLKNKSGAIGFLGHGDVLYFRNIRVKEITE